ncbi:MAG TPA: hypothetical protein VF283_04445 [Bryobacteraceae bacterium]
MLQRLFVATLSCAVLITVPLLAQTSAKSHAASSRTLDWRTYKLTMPKVDQWAAANQKIGVYLKAHPEFKKMRDGIAGTHSFAEMEHRARTEAPGLVKAIESSGLSYREWWNIFMTVTLSYTITELEKPGMPPPPSSVLPENIAFVKANKQKIENLLADYKNWNEPKK